jgi:hypothetical protein
MEGDGNIGDKREIFPYPLAAILHAGERPWSGR